MGVRERLATNQVRLQNELRDDPRPNPLERAVKVRADRIDALEGSLRQVVDALKGTRIDEDHAALLERIGNALKIARAVLDGATVQP